MDIKNITTATAKVKDLHPNTGQLEPMGVHANPRQISDEKFDKLRKSLEEHNLLGVLPIKAIRYNDEWVVIGGNMRVRALMANGCEDEEVEFIVVPENSDAQTIEGLILGDNAQFGDWDMQELGNWSDETLAKWDVDVEKFGNGLPDELQGLDLSPDEIEQITGDGKTEVERVIIVYKGDKSQELAALLGITSIEKVVYRFDGENIC